MRSGWLVGSLAVVALACGGGSSGGTADGGDRADAADRPDGGGQAPTLAELCGPGGLFERFVLAAYACAPELAVQTYGTPDATELGLACHAFYDGYLERGDAQLGTRAAFDACDAFLAGDPCPMIGLGEPSPCDGLLAGTLPTGSDCDASVQCAGDAYCDTSGKAFCGTCADRKANDMPCVDGDECASRHCATDRTCQPLGGTGQPCQTRGDCLGTLWCDTSTMCQPQPVWATGTPCGDALDCGAIGGDFYCDGGVDSCQPYANVGDLCGASADGRRCRVYQAQVCVNEGGTSRCVAATLGAVGAPCEQYTVNQCQAGLRCANHDGDNGTPRQCMAPLTEGMPCDPLDSYCDQLLDCRGNECVYGNYTNACPAP